MNNNSLNPVRTLGGLMEELFNNEGNTPRFFRDDFLKEGWFQENQPIPVNISENEDGFTLDVIAPGLQREDMKVQVSDGILHISFDKAEENKEEKKEDGQKILREEFKMKSFKRSFKLSGKVDAEKISAHYENGILHLAVPKKEQVKSANKFIEIA